MVVIRLSRSGANKKPFYHLVVSDKRSKRDGKYIERIGFFNPTATGQAVKLRIDTERLEYWRSVGAIPSDRVKFLYKNFIKNKTS
ncbi:MAG: 30S ribosomal protein S16 [Legionellales bacterium]|nr:30S ribosomal protein S16 [Legionellales bacterium]